MASVIIEKGSRLLQWIPYYDLIL